MRARIVKLIIRLVALLPLPAAHLLGTVIGHITYLLPNSLKRPLKINIDLCFADLPPEKRSHLYRNSFLEMTRAATETGALLLWNKTRILGLVKKVSGEHFLEQGFAKGKGVIIAAPHLGAWEIMGSYCSDKYPMTSLYRPMRLTGLNPFIKQSRERFGATLVPTNASGVRSLFKALEKNELVGILPDQDPGKEGSVFAPFCNTPASTMTLLPRLASKTGATVVYGYAERLPRGAGYHIHFLPASANMTHADLKQAAVQLNKDVEYCVRQCPEQYQWAYKRFKTRPAGEQAIY